MRRLIVSDDDNEIPANAQEVDLDDLMPETPALFLTIAWSNEGDVELNLGSVGYWEALGILDTVLRQLRDWSPEIGVQSTQDAFGVTHKWYEEEDDEEDDE